MLGCYFSSQGTRMNTYFLLAVAVGIPMIAVSGVGIAAEPTTPIGLETGTTSTPDGNQTFTAHVPKVVAAGEPIRIDAEFRNTGTGVVIVDVSKRDLSPPVRVQVRTAAGEPVPLTRYGESVLGAGRLMMLLRRGGDSIAFPIAQDGSIPFSIRNLALYYDVTIPGEYTVTVSRTYRIGEKLRDAKFQELVVSPIPFTVSR